MSSSVNILFQEGGHVTRNYFPDPQRISALGDIKHTFIFIRNRIEQNRAVSCLMSQAS